MNHAIEQQIKDNTLYVEVEPQPPEWMKDFYWDNTFEFKKLYFEGITNEGFPSKHCVGIPPISIGDTVYQGEEWFLNAFGDPVTRKSYHREVGAMGHHLKLNLPQTMPIELADKTFKVVGIEVEGESIIIKKWFWKYSLEEL